jgi:hypothetical protein
MDLRHYGPRTGFLYYNMIIPNKRAPLYIYDQDTPHSSSVGLMAGNRLQYPLFSKYISCFLEH